MPRITTGVRAIEFSGIGAPHSITKLIAEAPGVNFPKVKEIRSEI